MPSDVRCDPVRSCAVLSALLYILFCGCHAVSSRTDTTINTTPEVYAYCNVFLLHLNQASTCRILADDFSLANHKLSYTQQRTEALAQQRSVVPFAVRCDPVRSCAMLCRAECFAVLTILCMTCSVITYRYYYNTRGVCILHCRLTANSPQCCRANDVLFLPTKDTEGL